MRWFTACLLAAVAALCAGLAGCEMSSVMLRPTPPMKLYLDKDFMKAEVLAHVPIGTPIDEAKKIMKSHGFNCRYDRDPRIENQEGVDPARIGEVYLICSKFKTRGPWYENLCVTNEIELIFSIEEGKVREVRVVHHSTCM